MNPLALTSFTATSCIGRGVAATLATLHERRTGLAPCAFETVTLDTWVGEVAGVDEAPLPATLREFECRNNRLAHLGLAQDGLAEAVQRAAARYGREQAVPGLRRRARRYFHRRRRGVRAARASRGKPGRECGTAARGRRIERRAPHVRPASARPWCTRRHAAGARGRGTRSAGYRIHQLSRYRHAEQR